MYIYYIYGTVSNVLERPNRVMFQSILRGPLSRPHNASSFTAIAYYLSQIFVLDMQHM